MKPLAAAVLAFALALPANALTPESAAYLTTLGFDPSSEDVRLADKSGEVETIFLGEPATFSLEKLAASKSSKARIQIFITTRAFVERLKKNSKETVMPKKNYDVVFVAQAERSMVGDKVIADLLAGSAATASKKKSLSPAAEMFIRGIGLDPQSPDVKLAFADGTIETLRGPDEPMSHSLESLANEGNKARVMKFIEARVLIHKLKTDFADTPSPVDGVPMDFLTANERKLVLDKLFPKNGLSPAAEKFIRGIGLDPQSPDVKLAIADGTIETLRGPDEPMSHSLESLAKEKNKSGVMKFIEARVMIRKLKADFAGTPSPEGAAAVDAAYLTVKERRLVLNKIFPKTK